MVKNTEKIVHTGLFLAIGIILPPIVHSFNMGNVLSPMHFPVILCGLLVGWQYGLVCGFLTPLIAGFVGPLAHIGGPPLMPIGLTMSFELATYGLIAGLLYKEIRIIKNNIFNLYFAMIVAMIVGRIVYGLVNGILYLLNLSNTGFVAYLTTVFVVGIPGIILQILIIPAVVNAIENRYEKD